MEGNQLPFLTTTPHLYIAPVTAHPQNTNAYSMYLLLPFLTYLSGEGEYPCNNLLLLHLQSNFQWTQGGHTVHYTTQGNVDVDAIDM